jgi:hypothetical protein
METNRIKSHLVPVCIKVNVRDIVRTPVSFLHRLCHTECHPAFAVYPDITFTEQAQNTLSFSSSV